MRPIPKRKQVGGHGLEQWIGLDLQSGRGTARRALPVRPSTRKLPTGTTSDWIRTSTPDGHLSYSPRVLFRNMFLAISLIAIQDVAQSDYPLLSRAGAAIAIAVIVSSVLLYGFSRGVAYLISSRVDRTRAEIGLIVGHSVALLLLTHCFLNPRAHLLSEWDLALGTVTLNLGLLVVFAYALSRTPQRLYTQVFAASVAAALAVVVVQISFEGVGHAEVGPSSVGELGNVYYIVLDGHTSTTAIPTQVAGGQAIKQQIRRDYRRHGFEVYEGAYSNYIWTIFSLYSILDNRLHDDLKPIAQSKFVLPPNKLYERMRQAGYLPRIYGGDFLDLCAAAAVVPPACTRYPATQLGRELPSEIQFPLQLAGLFARVTHADLFVQKRSFFGVANAVSTFEKLIADVSQYDSNTFVMAHLMLPHEPFILDERCEIGESEVWDPQFVDYYIGTSREEAHKRWDRYIPQLACAHGMVMRLVEALKAAGIYEESTIIIHGDHGTRIGSEGNYGPHPESRRVSNRLFLDFYSALFAVKRGEFPLAPLAPELRGQRLPIINLLARLMGWPLVDGAEFVYRDSNEERFRLPEMRAD